MVSEASARPFTVLIADDDPLIRHMLALNLKLRNIAVYEVKDGREAVEFLERQTPDLIILDLGMPVMNGAQVCGWVRERGLNVPIMVLTAFAAPSLEAKMLEAGVDEYVTKPIVAQEFIARVQALLLRSVVRPHVVEKGNPNGAKPNAE